MRLWVRSGVKIRNKKQNETLNWDQKFLNCNSREKILRRNNKPESSSQLTKILTLIKSQRKTLRLSSNVSSIFLFVFVGMHSALRLSRDIERAPNTSRRKVIFQPRIPSLQSTWFQGIRYGVGWRNLEVHIRKLHKTKKKEKNRNFSPLFFSSEAFHTSKPSKKKKKKKPKFSLPFFYFFLPSSFSSPKQRNWKRKKKRK